MGNILDNPEKMSRLDSGNMRGSLEKLGEQIRQIASEAAAVELPVGYRGCREIVYLGMGGSALGGHIIKSVFRSELAVPLEIVNDYHVPGFVSEKSLVIVCSYSGTTEEPLAALVEARTRGAKIMAVTSGGEMAETARRLSIPALVFGTENNPCGSPRIGLGYTLFGPALLLSRAGYLPLADDTLNRVIATVERHLRRFGPDTGTAENPAKQLAGRIQKQSVWYVGAEHLSGSVHTAANQMNENAKRFAGFFLIPELNHHLMEGMLFPKNNPDRLLFIFADSSLYDEKIRKRFAVTKEILTKNSVSFFPYSLTETAPLTQAAEFLVFGGFVSYYAALLEGIDPNAIPFVDYFKAALKQ